VEFETGISSWFAGGQNEMILHDITELPSAEEQVVITNVNTKIATTLALMSALKYAEMPVIILDCKSDDAHWIIGQTRSIVSDGSYEYFSKLMNDFEFDLLSIPLRSYGSTLDWLFSHVPSRKVLLIDSDAELLNAEIIKLAHEYIDDENTFGFGFIDGPFWWDQHEVVRVFQEEPFPPRGYYEERPWLPFAMLKSSMVREATQAGCSFELRKVPNDFAPSQLISHYLLKRYRFSIFRKSNLTWLDPFKRSFHGHKPSWVLYDTGADVYQYLKYERGYDFVGLPARLHSRYVSHFWGLSRLELDPKDTHGTPFTKIQDTVKRRLDEVYGFSPEESSG
jgi:hypothetical protein